MITLRPGVFIKLEVENPSQGAAPLLVRRLDELLLREETAGGEPLALLSLHLEHRELPGLVLGQPD